MAISRRKVAKAIVGRSNAAGVRGEYPPGAIIRAVAVNVADVSVCPAFGQARFHCAIKASLFFKLLIGWGMHRLRPFVWGGSPRRVVRLQLWRKCGDTLFFIYRLAQGGQEPSVALVAFSLRRGRGRLKLREVERLVHGHGRGLLKAVAPPSL